MPNFTKLGRYLIRREIGQGAMGIVFEAFDPMIERTVAIKVLRPQQPSKETDAILTRFKREAQSAGRLSHSGIVSVFDYGEVIAETQGNLLAGSAEPVDGDRVVFIAMEFVKGQDLHAFFEANERFPLSEVNRLMGEILDALAYAHSQGVIHRDIKPSNLMVLDNRHVKITDFGIARIEGSEFTKIGSVMGSPSYMSPEQYNGQIVDHRSDLFACGVLLYQFLTGEKPFTGDSTTSIMYKVLLEEPMEPSRLNVSLQSSWDSLVAKALAKKPSDRYQSALEFATAIAALAGASASKLSQGDATTPLSGEPTSGTAVQSVAASLNQLANVVIDNAEKPTILIVDDTPTNLELLVAILRDDYKTRVAVSGEKALDLISIGAPPDLILLDVMMPGLNGYQVCQRLKSDPNTRSIPIIFVTAMGEVDDETRGLELGGSDYLTKPISPPIVKARIKTHLSMSAHARQLETLVNKLEAQANELAMLNQTLEKRVDDGVREVERLGRMKRFFSPSIVNLLLAGEIEDPLKTHRSEITVVFLDLRGFTSFTESSEPEDVMSVLHEYHQAMGEEVVSSGGTVEHFSGEGIMIFFNDPVPIDDPAGTAVRMAIAMQKRFVELAHAWNKRGCSLSMGIGIAQGFATVGAIGFEGRRDYGAIGIVTNLAARLCGEAAGGQILISQRVQGKVTEIVSTEEVRELTLKGFHRPVPAYSVLFLRDAVKVSN